MSKPTHYEQTKDWKKVVDKIVQDVAGYFPDNKSKEDFKAISNFNKWMSEREVTGNNFFDSRTYYDCFEIWLDINKHDTDYLEVIVGREGSGKSTLGLQKCATVDLRFNKDQIFNDIEKLYTWIYDNINDLKGRAILLDEGVLFTFSRESQSNNSKSMIKFFNLCRQYNLYVVICIPDWRLIDSYIRRHRINSLTAIIKQKERFVRFPKSSISTVNYLHVKKGIDMYRMPINENPYRQWPGIYHQIGWWNSKIPTLNGLSESIYRDDKREASKQFLMEQLDRIRAKKKELKEPYVRVGEASEKLDKHPNTIRSMCDKGILEHKVVNGQRLIKVDQLSNENC